MARRTKPAISLILKKPGICFITATLLQVLEKSCFTNFNTADFLKRDIAIEYYQLTSANRLWPSTSPLFLNELVRYLFWFIVKWRARLGVLFLNSVQIIFFFCDVKVKYFKFSAKTTLLPEMIHLNTNGARTSKLFKRKGGTCPATIGKTLSGQ